MLNLNDREQALNAVLTSIALEENALASLIEAETKKLCAVIAYIKCNHCPEDLQLLLDIQKSITAVLEQICCIETALMHKTELVVCGLKQHKPKPPKPCGSCNCCAGKKTKSRC